MNITRISNPALLRSQNFTYLNSPPSLKKVLQTRDPRNLQFKLPVYVQSRNPFGFFLLFPFVSKNAFFYSVLQFYFSTFFVSLGFIVSFHAGVEFTSNHSGGLQLLLLF